MKKFLVAIILTTIGTIIVALFWHEEYRYSLPTPLPPDYQEVTHGSCLSAIGKYVGLQPEENYFLHFFNPDCPCSRFNVPHIEHLLQTYQYSIRFAVILPEGADQAKARRLLGDEVRMIVDTDGFLAKSCGVYATPQAVIIDTRQALYFRGNYNRARFCTYPGTNFAEISLQMLLRQKPAPNWGSLATQAYGCQFPVHQSDSSLWKPWSFISQTAQ
ncbi:MAG: AhpC/TSA family protein [Bacteroidota bacterium]